EAPWGVSPGVVTPVTKRFGEGSLLGNPYVPAIRITSSTKAATRDTGYTSYNSTKFRYLRVPCLNGRRVDYGATDICPRNRATDCPSLIVASSANREKTFFFVFFRAPHWRSCNKLSRAQPIPKG